ncbi:hypothetical protein MARINOS108_11875 [Marinoscillum sp. 108]|nr:hypothetical protein MARINOS108_11875 [Marinoscillum sp. 108]
MASLVGFSGGLPTIKNMNDWCSVDYAITPSERGRLPVKLTLNHYC